ncbi:hypothetical protein PIB30_050195 [Stylosanthes scabra]|uniref:Uncharacterized protein n=1 Tax=Stylosanthes scabra TaxID=79078 RepID=A0ABU6UJG6_9FABA|nr:hypothetical protein [Stylosanthes scabra]
MEMCKEQNSSGLQRSKERLKLLSPANDAVTNNMCESWNAVLKNAKEKPILTLCEELRTHIMLKMAKHKRILSAYNGKLAPAQQKRVVTPRIFRPPGRTRKKRTKAGHPPPPLPINEDKEPNVEEVQAPTLGELRAKAKKNKKKMPMRTYVLPPPNAPPTHNDQPPSQEEIHGNKPARAPQPPTHERQILMVPTPKLLQTL